MRHRLLALLSAALMLGLGLATAQTAGATSVSVRIVGDAVGIDSTAVDTTSGPVGPGGCPGHSAGGAIDKAVGGNWDQMAFVSTILGETHTYAARDYWNLWINDTYSQQGICAYTVNPADRILVLVQRDDAASKPTVFPLTLAGVPATVTAQQPFTVTVREQRTDGATTTPTALAGATVAGGGITAQTDGDGHAALALPTPGQVVLRATRTGNVASDAAGVTVVAPATGASDAPAAPGAPPPPRPVLGHAPPTATLRGISDRQRFARGKGPRRLQAVIDSGTAGLLVVKLRLTRTDRGRCTYFSGRSERFRLNRSARCGAGNGFWFGVGSASTVDYLLPRALPRGRYVLDANAVDTAFDRDDARRRGANRVVFHVG
jgi:hypothetical protein